MTHFRLYSFCVLLMCAGCYQQPATNYLEREAALRASLPAHRVFDRYHFGPGDQIATELILVNYDTLLSLETWHEVDSILRAFGSAYYGHVDIYASESAIWANYSDSFALANPLALDSIVARIDEGDIDRGPMLAGKRK